MDQSTDTSQLEELVEHLRGHRLVRPLFERLAAELPANLTYHSARHSEDVFCEAIRFAALDGRTEREVEMVALAAAFHDAGFLVRYNDNEEIAADMLVRALLEDGGYTTEEVKLARTMVLDTKLVEGLRGMYQRPQTELSKYLLDADLSNLGRDDFFKRLDSLIEERPTDRMTALKASITLMNAHTWFSDSAKQLRQAKKDENFASLKQLIAELEV